MSRYEEPHFTTDRKVVSVWLATCEFADLPEDYFSEPYGGEDDEPWNQFSTDFGFGYYDSDFVESNSDEEERRVPIASLLGPCSYSASFLQAVLTAAAQQGITESAFVFLMFEFRYDPSVTDRVKSDWLQFIGVFPYSHTT